MNRLTRDWLRHHPLPIHDGETTKNSRGRVLLAGGSATVPGALRLTGEAVLRAGAGKLRMATVASVAVALGVFVPEAATVALPADDAGEITAEAAPLLIAGLERCDTYVLGPGMGDPDVALALVRATLAKPRLELSVVLDAAAVACAGDLETLLHGHEQRIVLTPHHGEMAGLTGHDAETIGADPERAACDAARRFGAIIVLKAGDTVIAAPGVDPLLYEGGGVGLATGGSGDVLAGIIGGLMSRGADPFVAAAWGVWLHGEAGRAAGRRLGPIGYLARDLLEAIPGLMAEV